MCQTHLYDWVGVRPYCERSIRVDCFPLFFVLFVRGTKIGKNTLEHSMHSEESENQWMDSDSSFHSE